MEFGVSPTIPQRSSLTDIPSAAAVAAEQSLDGTTTNANTQPPPKPTEETVECWENQRYVVFKGWGRYRLPVDRPSWSNKKGSLALQRESFLLPPGMQWKTPWLVEQYDGENEWYYAADFTIPTRFTSSKPSPATLVRRRKWVRVRVTAPFASSQMENASHDMWREYLFYGFTGVSAADLEAEQSRQHAGFVALCHLAMQSMADARNSPLPVEFVGEGSLGNDVGAAASPGALAAPPAAEPPKVTSAQFSAIYKSGIPNMLREHLWMAWSGASSMRAQARDYFAALSNEAALINSGETYSEIVQDVRRTAPRHPYFEGRGSLGSVRLTNTLLALSLHPDLPPYHQAFSYIVAVFLLNMAPVDAFWLMATLLQTFLFSGYHEDFMLQVDLRIIVEILRESHADLDAHFAARQIDAAVFASGWLQGLLCAHFPLPTACRIFDIMFAEGNSSILPRFVLAFLKLKKSEILQMDSSGAVGEYANSFARSAFDIDGILAIAHQDNFSARVLRRRDELLLQHQHAVKKFR